MDFTYCYRFVLRLLCTYSKETELMADKSLNIKCSIDQHDSIFRVKKQFEENGVNSAIHRRVTKQL